MDRTETLLAAQAAIAEDTARIAALLRAQTDLSAPIAGGSSWTARDAAVHLANNADLYAEIANGTPSPFHDPSIAGIAAKNADLLADVAETDPDKLATLVEDAADRLLRVTAGRPGDQPAPWHFHRDIDIASLASISVGERLLHGYDIATAVGAPWRIDPGHALLALESYAPLADILLSPLAATHTATYGIELRGGPAFTMRFADGVLALEAAGGPADTEISADPVAFLLAFSGRIPRWPAFALGLITVAGPRPELGLGFQDLFVFP